MARLAPAPLRPWPAALLVAAAALLAPLSGARAAAGAPASAAPGLVSMSYGRTGFRDARVGMELALTYHLRPRFAGVRPVGGVIASTGGDALVFVGCDRDLLLPRGWGVTPLFSGGYYSDGLGTGLGGALEFRSAISCWRALGPWSRIGVGIDHISNAGIFDRNPGRESVFFTVTSRR